MTDQITIHVRVDRKMKQWFVDEAERKKQPLSLPVREALQQYMESQEDPPLF